MQGKGQSSEHMFTRENLDELQSVFQLKFKPSGGVLKVAF